MRYFLDDFDIKSHASLPHDFTISQLDSSTIRLVYKDSSGTLYHRISAHGLTVSEFNLIPYLIYNSCVYTPINAQLLRYETLSLPSMDPFIFEFHRLTLTWKNSIYFETFSTESKFLIEKWGGLQISFSSSQEFTLSQTRTYISTVIQNNKTFIDEFKNTEKMLLFNHSLNFTALTNKIHAFSRFMNTNIKSHTKNCDYYENLLSSLS
jgi:hypothetical protein